MKNPQTTKIILSLGEDAAHVLRLALLAFMEQPQENMTKTDFEIAKGLMVEVECLGAEVFDV